MSNRTAARTIGPRPPARGVIFDMDGVLIDSEPLHTRIETGMFIELGIRLTPGEHREFLGTSTPDMFSVLVERFGLDRTVEELVSDERRRYLEVMDRDGVPPVPGAFELAAELHRSGWRLAVASSAPREQIDRVMDSPVSGGTLGRFFSAIASGDEVARSKPDPAIFLLAAARMGLTPDRCWVIEDSANGLRAARSAGMRCIGYSPDPLHGPELSDARHRAGSMDLIGRILREQG